MYNIKRWWFAFTDQYGTTPIHPQFIINRLAYQAIEEAKIYTHGALIDIGCGRMAHRAELEKITTKYIGLDHPKLSKLYPSPREPDVYGNAMKIPLKDEGFDSALLLQVLEHLDNPQKALDEAYRILRKGGYLILSVPFMYPIHDAPYDYYRFTEYALSKMLKKTGFTIIKQRAGGNFLEFWIQSLIVYLFKAIDGKIKKRMNLIELIYLVPLLIVMMPMLIITNVLVWILSFFSNKSNYQSHDYVLNYTIVAQK